MHCSLNELEDAALTFPVLFQDVIYQVISMHRRICTFLFCLTYEFFPFIFVTILSKEINNCLAFNNYLGYKLQGGLSCIRNTVEHCLLPQCGNVGH